jgi:predicted nucleic acid-binding protein
MTVFVDTGVLFAAAASRDRSHRRASELLHEIEEARPFTSDHVIVETWSLLSLRFGHSPAMRFWSGLRGTPLDIECIIPLDLERGHAISERWADQEFDIVDCTSFAVMERIGCRRAASFDDDFAIYRFGPDRRQAFEILR